VPQQDDETALRAELARQYQHLESVGLNELASGNVSCRFGQDMLISASGATAANITADTVVEVTLDGEWKGERKPSSEWQMHAAIYKNTRAKAVVHTHSDHCVALSCHGRALPGFHYLVGTFGGSDVPCVAYSTFGTQQLAADASDALLHRSACLLGAHGMISRGDSLADAVSLAHRLEIMCRQYLLACQLGEPYLLTDEEWDEFFIRFNEQSYGSSA
jgi:L-fuculose-phosphate aldolase